MVVLHRMVHLNSEVFEYGGIFLTPQKGRMGMRSIGNRETKGLRTPQNWSEEVHGVDDVLSNALSVLHSRSIVDRDVQRAGF